MYLYLRFGSILLDFIFSNNKYSLAKVGSNTAENEPQSTSVQCRKMIFRKAKPFLLEVGEIQQGCKMASAPPISANPCKSFQSKESVLEGQTPVISRKLVLKEGSKWKSTCRRARNHICFSLPAEIVFKAELFHRNCPQASPKGNSF